MSNTVTLRLTPKQAAILWAVVDGASDAGACKDGMTPQEHVACSAIIEKLFKQYEKWKDARAGDVNV